MLQETDMFQVTCILMVILSSSSQSSTTFCIFDTDFYR
jgi:hypothetical protein